MVVQLSVPYKNFDGLFVPDPYISSWVNHYSMFFSCLTQKNIYFLRMGGWPSLKTERRRQKWTSDMESGIIYCFWLCSCLCHKRIWMDYLFQIHIFHPGSTTIQNNFSIQIFQYIILVIASHYCIPEILVSVVRHLQHKNYFRSQQETWQEHPLLAMLQVEFPTFLR